MYNVLIVEDDSMIRQLLEMFIKESDRYTLAAARRKSGVGKFSLYALRHIVASEQLAAGADVAAVAANLGHSSPQITLSYYAHTSPKAQKEASAKIGAVWCSSEEKVE